MVIIDFLPFQLWPLSCFYDDRMFLNLESTKRILVFLMSYIQRWYKYCKMQFDFWQSPLAFWGNSKEGIDTHVNICRWLYSIFLTSWYLFLPYRKLTRNQWCTDTRIFQILVLLLIHKNMPIQQLSLFIHFLFGVTYIISNVMAVSHINNRNAYFLQWIAGCFLLGSPIRIQCSISFVGEGHLQKKKKKITQWLDTRVRSWITKK